MRPWPGHRRAAGGGDRVRRGGRVLVGEGQWCPGAARVPGDVAGEHADEHVGFDAFLEPVVDGPQVQVVGFDVPEVPLRPGISRRLSARLHEVLVIIVQNGVPHSELGWRPSVPRRLRSVLRPAFGREIPTDPLPIGHIG